jgi:hypothetical protein
VVPVVGLSVELPVLWQLLAVVVIVVVVVVLEEEGVCRSCWLGEVVVGKTPCWGGFDCVGTVVGWIQLVPR